MAHTIEKDDNKICFSYRGQLAYHEKIKVVEFKDLKDKYDPEDKSGEILLWLNQWPDNFTLQFRAKQSLTDGSKERNVIATAHLSIAELEELLAFAKQLSKSKS